MLVIQNFYNGEYLIFVECIKHLEGISEQLRTSEKMLLSNIRQFSPSHKMRALI